MAASGTVELHPSYGKMVVVLVDATDPDDTGGIGGWQPSTRMLQPPGYWWAGGTVKTFTLDCILDLWEHSQGTNVETRLERLQKMGQPDKKHGEPPAIRLRGDVTPWQKHTTWVLQDMETLARDLEAPGKFQRYHLALTLERLTRIPDVSAVEIKRTRAKGASAPSSRTYITKAGDTLRSIAVKELGSSGQYTEIQGWNKQLKKTDPDQPLRGGLKVILH